MKMKIILTSIPLLIGLISYGQSDSQKDSLINEICKLIIENAGQSDSIKIAVAYDRHLIPYLSKYSKEEQEKIWQTLYYRMQFPLCLFRSFFISLSLFLSLSLSLSLTHTHSVSLTLRFHLSNSIHRVTTIISKNKKQ